jgi:hypothetical protein
MQMDVLSLVISVLEKLSLRQVKFLAIIARCSLADLDFNPTRHLANTLAPSRQRIADFFI